MLQIGGATESFTSRSCVQASWREADVPLAYSEVRPDTVSETSLQVLGSELTRKANAKIKALSVGFLWGFFGFGLVFFLIGVISVPFSKASCQN